jgi:signal transduction histidine kinase
LSATLAELRKLSESNAELLMRNIGAGHVASRATRMLALTSALAEVDTVTDVTDVILGLGLDVVGAACGLIGRAERGRLCGIRVGGYDNVAETRLLSSLLDESSPLGSTIKSGMPVYLSSAQEYEARFPLDYQDVGFSTQAQAYAALPLIHHDVLIGGLGLGFHKPTTFGRAERIFLRVFAGVAACALARAIQCDAERTSKRDCELLARTRIDLLGVVAHDLRNPLNLIQITAEMLRDAKLPAPTRDEMLERCIRATQQMNRLIEDLLDATHIRAGGLRLELAAVDLKELLSQINDAYRPLAHERRIFWEASGPDAPTTARMDASRVLQAVGNLVGNALKFTPPGGHVAVRASVTSHDVVIAVSDSGPGMPPEALGHVFEAFWQGKTDRRGIGLGLTIAKGIAEAHGGRIDVETTHGKGCTFRLILPLASVATRAA